MTASPTGFDALAAGYDQDFGASAIGRVFRSRVQARLDARFHAGQRVLELNCGTGDDAIHLARKGARVLATDQSAAMLAVADRKVRAAGLADSVELRPLAIEELGQLAPASLDGAFSNLGGLNCVAELAPVGRDLARLL
ncbi:MAG: methyltransferase domain-containing protein, partial [Thermoflexales bacterium]